MGKKRTIKSLVWVLILSLVILGVPLYPLRSVQAAEYATAKLSEIQGGVYIKKSGGGQEFNGFNGMSLTQGDWLRTGSNGFAKIVYKNGTETSLDANTQVVIEKLTSKGESSQTTVKLTSGGIWNKVKSFLNMDDEYEVETPTAVLGVRGTLYHVSQDNRTGTVRGLVIEGQVNGQENNLNGIRRGRELFTGQEFELGDTPGQQARVRDIDQSRLITQSQPRMLSQILMDLNDRLEELLDLAQKAKSSYTKEQNTNTLSLAFILADQSRELAQFAVEFTRNVKGSQKAEAVDGILRTHNLNLDQLESDFERSQSETDQLWSEIQELAQETDLSKSQINAVLNQGFEASLYGTIVKALARTSQSNNSGGGGRDSNPPPINHDIPDDIQSSANSVDNGNKTAAITVVVKNASQEALTNLTDRDFTVKLRGESYVVADTPTLQGFTHLGNGVYKVTFNPGFAVNEVVEIVVKGVSIERNLRVVISDPGDTNPPEPNPPADLLSAAPSQGSAVGTTRFASLPNLPAGASKFQVKVQTTLFSPPNLNDLFEGNDYTAGADIPAAVGEYIVLTAVNDANQIKAYYTVKLTSAMIRPNSASTKIRINSMELASVNSQGIQGDDSSNASSISGDGQRVVFVSSADNLVPNADRNTYNVYAHNRQTGLTEQVNVSSDGTMVPGALMPAISDNGRYAAFVSNKSGLVAGDTNGDDDIFVRDLDAGTTVRVSVSTGGTEARNGFFGPGWPAISGDGRYVVFSSDDTTLIPGDTIQDIFLRDRDVDNDGLFDEPGGVSTSRVNISSEEQPANEDCYFPVISADGRFVAFSSSATNLVPGITTFGIFVRDLQANKTSYIAQGGSPDLSDNGRFVVFDAYDSAQLVPGDTNQKDDLFIMDRDSDENGIFDETGYTSVERITLNANGEQVNENCYGPKISGDGRYVVYYSAATNLIPGVTNGQDNVYLYDRVSQQTKLISTSKTGWPADDVSFEPSISSDAKHISFNSDATNLVANDTNGDGDVFVADLDLNSPLDTEPPVFSEGSGLAGEEIGPSWLKLTWSEATDNLAVMSYSLYRGTNPEGPFTELATLESGNLSYWDTDLAPETDYYYYVLAGDEDGNWSAVPATPAFIETIAEPAVVPETMPLAAGIYHSLAIAEDGLVWAWGDNSDGQLGDGTTEERWKPVPVLGPGGSGYLTDVAAIAADYYSSMALKEDGTVWTWGKNDVGLLGIGTKDWSHHPAPVQVKGYKGEGYLTGIKAVAASQYHFLALKSDGTVWAWGDNSDGELGDGTDTDRFTPVPVKSPDGSGYLTGIIAIAVGDVHSAALKNDGTVWTWGQNSYGQLGYGGGVDWDTHSLPQQVPGLSGVVSIGTGQYHTLAIKNDGTVWAWGENYYGELGDGTATRRTSPVQVLGEDGVGNLNNISSVAGGYYYSLAIKNDQSVWAWGCNDYGQLGRPLGSTYYFKTPAQSAGLTGITYVAAGEEHSIAMDRDGNVWTLGYNRYGQLGIGSSDYTEHPTPVKVTDFTVDVDTTPPSVTSTEPYHEAAAVYADQTVHIDFSEAVQAGETFNDILFVDSLGNPIEFDKQISGISLTLDPTNLLGHFERYTITIPSGALKDSAGNLLSESYSFSFTTGDQDVEPPQV